MGRIYCMSDIHGLYQVFCRRLDRLENLYAVLEKAAQDKLIRLGSYIDGGLDSFKVLDLIHTPQRSCPERGIVLPSLPYYL